MTFKPLAVSSKFAICGLPLRLDTYKSCGFDCTYCFANNRVIGAKQEKECNIDWLKKKFKKVYDETDVNPNDFLEVLLKNRISLHGGGRAIVSNLLKRKKE